MSGRSGEQISHPEYGPGKVIETIGDIAICEFFGERLEVSVSDLLFDRGGPSPLLKTTRSPERTTFRRAYEAINLGVVPPNPEQLTALSIGYEKFGPKISKWLTNAPAKGLCKVFFGDYGTGKSHHLRMVEAVALSQGWVVSFVEFDPKQADPAKPHLVYRAVMSALRFPQRFDHSRSRNFSDFIKEVRQNWDKTANTEYFRRSPWFFNTLEVLRHFSHSESDQDYVNTVEWLAGQPVQVSAVKNLMRKSGQKLNPPPIMPRVRETADIYILHLVVVNELCRMLGYKGLLLILDEAEHVRGFNAQRKLRANNFFDVLARSAHVQNTAFQSPWPNEHGYALPTFWKQGPHFGLVVGLTEADTFSDSSLSLHEACVFLHEDSDRVHLTAAGSDEYRDWCVRFLSTFVTHYPQYSQLILEEPDRLAVADVMTSEFGLQKQSERTMRTWIKLGSFVVSLLLSDAVKSHEELLTVVQQTAREASGQILPWES